MNIPSDRKSPSKLTVPSSINNDSASRRTPVLEMINVSPVGRTANLTTEIKEDILPMSTAVVLQRYWRLSVSEYNQALSYLS